MPAAHSQVMHNPICYFSKYIILVLPCIKRNVFLLWIYNFHQKLHLKPPHEARPFFFLGPVVSSDLMKYPTTYVPYLFNSLFCQAAVPQIIERTDEAFFERNIDMLRQTADICCSRISEIPCLTCPDKPKGSMALMVRPILRCSYIDNE